MYAAKERRCELIDSIYDGLACKANSGGSLNYKCITERPTAEFNDSYKMTTVQCFKVAYSFIVAPSNTQYPRRALRVTDDLQNCRRT